MIEGTSERGLQAGRRPELPPAEEALRAYINRRTMVSAVLDKVDPELYQELVCSRDLEDARSRTGGLVHRRYDHYHSLDCQVEDLERVNALSCLQVLRNIISERNEKKGGCSTLSEVLTLCSRPVVPKDRQLMFMDFLHLAKGTRGDSGIYSESAPRLDGLGHIEAARLRSDYLDILASRCVGRALTYPTGLDPSVIKRRESHRARVLDVLGGSNGDWEDYEWHLRNTISDADTASKIIELTPEEDESIRLANKLGLQFGISPYYISLMDSRTGAQADHALRAQVIPRLEYVEAMAKAIEDGRKGVSDFMLEGFTSPVKSVTRRYPMIAIFKPINSCAQFCTYCQRNWEVEGPGGASRPIGEIDLALEWFEQHTAVSEVLLTGGDPLVLQDAVLSKILTRFKRMSHIKHIRIGTRLPVVLPMRFTERLISLLEDVNRPPAVDVCVVTHFEHPYEVTPESLRAVQSLRRSGIMVYNQQVFTFENCRRFESVALRLALKQIGVDPYYTFNTKGKEETGHFRVPIARILQERKEEARLIPGLSRTDEPVFNIPGLGKNPLRAWQHHDLIMLSPGGERIYEFHPWEKNIALAPTYLYRDVPIGRFLERLAARGENVEEYESIWYYL
ncbi:MAG: KamA family radical SAM protein [Methanomassiliicoccales archaeon]|nr:KamA family radical SAM protein [Methanomassiliicoccales archaeon]